MPEQPKRTSESSKGRKPRWRDKAVIGLIAAVGAGGAVYALASDTQNDKPKQSTSSSKEPIHTNNTGPKVVIVKPKQRPVRSTKPPEQAKHEVKKVSVDSSLILKPAKRKVGATQQVENVADKLERNIQPALDYLGGVAACLDKASKEGISDNFYGYSHRTTIFENSADYNSNGSTRDIDYLYWEVVSGVENRDMPDPEKIRRVSVMVHWANSSAESGLLLVAPNTEYNPSQQRYYAVMHSVDDAYNRVSLATRNNGFGPEMNPAVMARNAERITSDAILEEAAEVMRQGTLTPNAC